MMRSIVSIALMLCFYQSINFAQWAQAINGMGNQIIGALLADGDTLYAGSNFDMYKSTNQGDSWFTVNNGLPSFMNFNSIVRSSNVLVAGGDGIWLSSNNGASWNQTKNGIDSVEYIQSLYVDGNNVYAAIGYPSAVGISTDNGNTWTKHTNGIASSQLITGVTKLGSTLFATHSALAVHVSSDNGVTWELPPSGIGAQDKNAIVTSSTNLCVATTNGIWTSTDNGITWDHTLTTGILTGFGKHGNYLYTVGSLPPYRSNDDGVTWTVVDDNGLVSFINNTIQFTSQYALINTFGIGVYRRSLSEITAVEQDLLESIPKFFNLEQNYPNPFNPSTKISWRSPIGSWQTLTIYDVLGNEVATLVDQYKETGSYEVEFNALNLSSGVYFYKIQVYPAASGAGSFVETKKMILIR